MVAVQVNLSDFTRRAEQHFLTLSEERKQRGWPVFALEHEFSETEVQQLERSLAESIATQQPRAPDGLLWTIYAAERGYNYEGDEYWQSFEGTLPGWKEHGNRHWIRAQFRRFQESYHGAVPEGVWAKQFSIICWPIMHAILPKDLQRHLARVLYDLRHSLSRSLLDAPADLGERIQALSWNSSSRFQNLAQEKLLTGQIAAALLLKGRDEVAPRILPSTLDRISRDLGKESQAQHWLQAARRQLGQRIVLGGGLSRRLADPARTATTAETARELAKALAIEPRLVLLPLESSSWQVLLEIPDLSPLLFRFPDDAHALTNAGCTVAGSSGRPLARGRLFQGVQQVILRTWPDASQVLLRFDGKFPAVESLLRAEALLRPGPIWVFRIGSDGTGQEVRGKVVRAGQRYILVSRAGPLPEAEELAAVYVQCEGIWAAQLTAPPRISWDLRHLLEDLKLQAAMNCEIKPIGLMPMEWDGEGRAVWLTSDVPKIEITSDFAVESIRVRLQGQLGAEKELKLDGRALSHIVELGSLPADTYDLTVHTHDGVSESRTVADVIVREPVAASAASSGRAPFWLSLDPTSPTMEDFWEGRVRVEMHGPAGCTVKGRAEFFRRGSESPVVWKSLPPLILPISPEVWRKTFYQSVSALAEVRRVYDETVTCRIVCDAGELGRRSVRCEREFAPLRWAVRRIRNEVTLRLIDDGDLEIPAVISRYEFATPDRKVAVAAVDGEVHPSRLAVTGGLYVASSGEYRKAILLPPTKAHLGFDDLRTDAQLLNYPRTSKSIIDLLGLLELWWHARLTGDMLALTRRRAVSIAILHRVMTLINGQTWDHVENALDRAKDASAISALTNSSGPLAKDAVVVRKLIEQAIPAQTVSPVERIPMFSAIVSPILSATGVRSNDEREWLSEFALRLACGPENIVAWSGERCGHALAALLERPVLSRAARFFVLETARLAPAQPIATDCLYPEWRLA